MRKLLNQTWFVALLAVGAIAFVGQALLPGENRTKAGIAEKVPADPAEGEFTVTDKSPDGLNRAMADLTKAADLRDPFTPISVRAAIATPVEVAFPDIVETVHLSAIWSQAGTTFVLLNGRICQIGDEIGRLKVESATTDGVWLTHGQSRSQVMLGNDFTLRIPGTGPSATPSTL